jgi:transitional endoplasmic reticulum ATPase
MSQWVGTSERSVREVFRKARQASPCILFFDEIDSLVPSRGGSGDSGVTQRVVSQFLAELDGIEDLAGVVVVGATNRPDIVDPALLRPGRFDLLLELPMPDRSACLAILKIHTRGKPLDRLVNLESLADTAADLKFTGAELAALCNRAALLAIRQRLEKQDAGTPGRGDTGTKTTGHGNRLAVSRTPADPYADFTITRAHMDEALKLVARQKTQVGRPVGR